MTETGMTNKLIKETKTLNRPLPQYKPFSEQERQIIDPSNIFFEEPPEYLQRAEGKAFASRGDFAQAAKNTSQAVTLHKYRTTAPS